jgi:hypothetical protein
MLAGSLGGARFTRARARRQTEPRRLLILQEPARPVRGAQTPPARRGTPVLNTTKGKGTSYDHP